MPLTPEDVSNKRFTPVRLREGYDMGEVDQFLDEVEAELARLTRENDDLRSKLAARPAGWRRRAAAGPGDAPSPSRPPSRPVKAPEPVARGRLGAAPVETIKVTTVADASSAAARLLEIATRNADELVADAKDQADKIVGEARTKAERLESESKVKADRLESDARTRSQMLDSETAERRQQLFGDLEKEKDKLNAEVENLRSFEREYRSRLKSYFQQQLAALDGNGEGGPMRRRATTPRSGSSPSSATTPSRPAWLTRTSSDRHRRGRLPPPGTPASALFERAVRRSARRRRTARRCGARSHVAAGHRVGSDPGDGEGQAEVLVVYDGPAACRRPATGCRRVGLVHLDRQHLARRPARRARAAPRRSPRRPARSARSGR